MRNPTVEECAPLIEIITRTAKLRAQLEREHLRPLADSYNDEHLALCEACGVPAGTMLDEANALWINQSTKQPLIP